MQQLENTTPHFIRCIQPNNKQRPRQFEHDFVLHQLKCCGVLEVVRISRAGYPTRMTHQQFAERLLVCLAILFCREPRARLHDYTCLFCSILAYQLTSKFHLYVITCRYGLLLSHSVASQNPLSISVAVLQQFNIPPEMYQVGYTKLFLRTGQV